MLWRLFGTTNQLTAGLALAVIAVWVTKRSRNPIAVIVPLVFLVTMTSWALFVQFFEFVEAGEWVLAPLDAIIFVDGRVVSRSVPLTPAGGVGMVSRHARSAE